jgi:hypothetical protein
MVLANINEPVAAQLERYGLVAALGPDASFDAAGRCSRRTGRQRPAAPRTPRRGARSDSGCALVHGSRPRLLGNAVSLNNVTAGGEQVAAGRPGPGRPMKLASMRARNGVTTHNGWVVLMFEVARKARPPTHGQAPPRERQDRRWNLTAAPSTYLIERSLVTIPASPPPGRHRRTSAAAPTPARAHPACSRSSGGVLLVPACGSERCRSRLAFQCDLQSCIVLE